MSEEINVCPSCGMKGTIYSTRNASNNRHCCACPWEGELSTVKVSEQERKTWGIFRVGGSNPWAITCDEGEELGIVMSGIPTTELARQIASDHNRVGELEAKVQWWERAATGMHSDLEAVRQRAERAEAALAAVAEAGDLVLRSASKMYRGYWNGGQRSAVGEEALCCLEKALEQARAVLPTKQEEEG